MLRHLLGLQKTDVLFLCSSPIDEVWVRSTALACRTRGLRVELAICGEASDCPQATLDIYARAGIKARAGMAFSAAARIPCRLAVTASSGLDRTIFPTRAKAFIHMPHSLASLHMIYPEGAFDGYDVLFAAGPQHGTEFAAIVKDRHLSQRRSLAVGYGKLDILVQQFANCAKSTQERPLVLLAPSWGNDNLLDRCGVSLAASLSAKGFDVVVRPHPLFFLDGAPVLDDIRALEQRDSKIRLESPFSGDEAIFAADVLVGDYSGISFEFAALRKRPVVSVDVGLKVANPAWQSLGLQPVEIACREHLGPVLAPDVDAIVAAVEKCIAGDFKISDENVESFLYGRPGECAGRAVEQIEILLSES